MSQRHATNASAWNLEAALQRVTHWLPTQGPIKDFIHHNTLHAFQDRPFHEAIGVAAKLYGANRYMPLDWYRSAYREGAITESALVRVAREHGIGDGAFSAWKENLLQRRAEDDRPRGIARSGIREARREREGISVDELVHPMLFRLLSSYLDQGVSIWRMPHAHDSFWTAVRRLVGESLLPVPPLSDKGVKEWLDGTCEAAIEACLERLVGDPALYERYLLETLLAHPGWSGMIGVLETSPSSLLTPRPIRLRELLAVELMCEVGWLRRRLGNDFSPARGYVPPSSAELVDVPPPTREVEATRCWHEAYEWTCYENALTLLEKHGGKAAVSPVSPRFQAFFCIDDRECSTRRHLEDVEPRVETFAVAGFFGVDFLFQPAGSAHAFQYCPVVLTPKHVVREIAAPGGEVAVPSLKDRLHLSPASNTLFRGWLLTQTLGVLSLLRLAGNILWPSSKLIAGPELTETEVPTQLELFRDGDTRTSGGQLAGYSLDEMADRVMSVLNSTGVGNRLSKLAVFFAHGASSANNPHFAAYNCGACSGKRGAPNARAFATMANHPEVRARLEARGMKLPADAVVVGAIHDTTRDEVTYFDTELIPASHQDLFFEFRRKMEQALAENAVERCRRFELAPRRISGPAARAHVRNRAVSIFEPRPELNHATNALCIVGRRELTRGLFFDRRAFLNSYDPLRDPTGNVLEGILGAVVPVCGGINLEYYFSRVDAYVYGAGSKLPHNVVSLLGVANGVEGDLLTGLPTQMTEMHDPVRLLLVVEQEPELVLDVAKRRPGVYEWIVNDWMKLIAFSPSQRRNYHFRDGRMIALDGLPDLNPRSQFVPVSAQGGRP